jgi:hypothetical protein
MTSALMTDERPDHPVDRIEAIVSDRNWPFQRASEDEISIVVGGRWADYDLSISWDDGLEALHVVCAFDFKVPPKRREDVRRLNSLINEQLWSGHFDLWSVDGLLMCRTCLILSGGAEVNDAQCDRLIQVTLESCERYFPAFQFLIWAGKTAEEAMEAAMLETVGEA